MDKQEIEARRSFIGASEVPKLLGIGSPWELFADKRPDRVGEPVNDDEEEEDDESETPEEEILDRGNRLEAPIAKWAADKLFKTSEALKITKTLQVPEWHLGATPDFAISPRDFGRPQRRLLEVKSSIVRFGWGREGTDEVPARVLLQAMTQLGVAREIQEREAARFRAAREIEPEGRDPLGHMFVSTDEGRGIHISDFDLSSVDVARLDGSLRLSLYRVEWNAELFERIRAAANAFWVKHVETGEPPPPGSGARAREWLRRVFPQAIPGSLVDGGAEDEELVSRWLRAKGEAKALTERVKADANEIKARIATNAGLRLRGMQGVAFYENRKASPSWKNAARELAQRVADLTSGNVEELLEDARAKSVPPVGPRSLRWSSKLNPNGLPPKLLGAKEGE